jgi:RND family efflux transporter MFP subunit
MNYETRIDSAGDGAADLGMGYAGAVGGGPAADGPEADDRSRRQTILVIAVAAVVLIGLWLFMHRRSGDDIASATGQAATVSVVMPGKATIAGTISATGTLAARRDMPVGSVGEGGQVVEVRVEAGDWVRQGQVLAVVDRSVQVQQQASQSAQVSVAEADARIAQANYDRALKLVDRGFISKADVDRLAATRDAAVARVNVARATLGQLRAQAARLNIVAPADGLVLERRVEPGQVVGGGAAVLFRIAKGGELEMLARLSETDLAAIHPGVSAAVTPAGSDKAFTGQVWQVSPIIDATSRQGTARIALAYAPELRPGGFANVEIRAGTVVAPKLPESALLSDNGGSYVYIVGQGNRIERRPVKTGIVSADGIAVVSGLSGNERVVLRAGGFLQPGETVNPKVVKLPAGPASPAPAGD